MGPGHCGSTLLDVMLGSHTNAFSLGEMRHISSRLYNYNDSVKYPSICGICEGPCPFWNNRVSINILRRFFPKKIVVLKID